MLAPKTQSVFKEPKIQFKTFFALFVFRKSNKIKNKNVFLM